MIELPRALVAVDLSALPTDDVDVLVVGSGIAGLTVANSLAGQRSVAVMTKGRLGVGSTLFAQGGVAASVAPDDTPALHFNDTLVAGAGLCDPDAVHVLVEEAPDAVAYLEACGVRLDLEGLSLAVTREGGHSRRRVVHAGGDATGAEIVRALLQQVGASPARVIDESFLLDLVTDGDDALCGAIVLRRGALVFVRSTTVVLASGGYGQLYAETTSPRPCTGDGAAAALRAGATLGDIEFVQFHPTTLVVEADPRPLLSEAMRGEGATLVDGSGSPVMAGVHPLGDLAPRDVVARALYARMHELGVDHLYLDATRLGEDYLVSRFPTIVAACRSNGIDPANAPIPIAPACHYTMGGVVTDLDGRTDLPGLYAVGEVASSGVHGANRLASNSLLEGAVFGRRAARAIAGEQRRGGAPAKLDAPAAEPHAGDARARLRRAMLAGAGVVRDGTGLAALAEQLEATVPGLLGPTSASEFETANLATIGLVLVHGASRRTESRGGHFRVDYPEPDPAWQRHQRVQRDPEGSLVFGVSDLIAPLAPASA